MKKSAHLVLFENLNLEMSKRHLSHADVAHRSGLSLSAVQEITSAAEAGLSVNLDKLDRIASAFGLTAAQLISPAEVEKPADPTAAARAAQARRANENVPKQLAKLIEEFFILPEADRMVLINTASDMASKYKVHIRSH